MIVKKQETVETEVCVCDFCKHESPGAVQCAGCGKDVCGACGVNWYVDPWTGEHVGDWWQRACTACHQYASEMRNDAKKVREQYEAEIERIESAWKQRCKHDGASECTNIKQE